MSKNCLRAVVLAVGCLVLFAAAPGLCTDVPDPPRIRLAGEVRSVNSAKNQLTLRVWESGKRSSRTFRVVPDTTIFTTLREAGTLRQKAQHLRLADLEPEDPVSILYQLVNGKPVVRVVEKLQEELENNRD